MQSFCLKILHVLTLYTVIFTGMDKTYQRGDLMSYGALIKLVPAHWSKGNDLNKNTRSCWYRPGFRWSPERGQSVIPKDLEKFEVIVLKFQSCLENK